MVLDFYKNINYKYIMAKGDSFRKLAVNFQKLSWRNRIVLLSLLLTFLIILLGNLVNRFQHAYKNRAEETKEEKLATPPKPEYAPGEVIVKFKQPLTTVKSKQGLLLTANFDKEKIDIDQIDQASLPPILQSVIKQYGIKTIEKIFKGAQDPQTELNKFKTKFSKEIAKGEKKIDEKELLNLDFSRTYLLNFDQNVKVDQIIKELKLNQEIEYTEPNYIYKTQLIPNDPEFDKLWGIKNSGQTGGTNGADIHATEAWDIATGSSDIVVGIIDTGIDYNHQDLINNIWKNPSEIPNDGIDNDGNGYIDDVYGWNFVSNNNNPIDDNGHGTHVSGTIGASGNNGIGIVGVNWNIKIMALKFLDSGGSGYTTDAANAINYATKMGVKITNNSWGGGWYSTTLYEVIQQANSSGSLFIAAAGNNGSNNDQYPSYPASYDLPNIISVAATDKNDQLTSFSNFGVNSVDIAAPGKDIYSTYLNNTYKNLSGTSMATPHIAGISALILSSNLSLSAQEIKTRLLFSADPQPSLQGKIITGGRANVYKALKSQMSIFLPTRFQIKVNQGSIFRTSLLINNPSSTNPLTWNLQTSNTWVTFSPSSGIIPTNSFQHVVVDISAINLSPQNYNTSLHLQTTMDGYLNIDIPLTVKVISVHKAQWLKTIGGTDEDVGTVISKDNSNNIIIAGYFRDTVDFDGTTLVSFGSKDMFVAKYDASGNKQWVKQIISPNDIFSDVPSGIAADSSNNIYLTGSFESTTNFDPISLTSLGKSDVFIAKYSPTGEILWVKKIGSSLDDESTSMITDSSDNIYLAGNSYGSIDYETGSLPGSGSYLIKYNNLGEVMWAKRSLGKFLASDDSRGFYVCGSFGGTIKIANDVLTSAGYEDVLLIKYDKDGNAIWARSGGDTDVDRCSSLVVDNNQNIYIAGKYYGPAKFGEITLPDGFADIFIAKYNPSGDLLFVKQSTSPMWLYKEVGGITVDSSNNPFLTGYFEEQIIFEDFYLKSGGYPYHVGDTDIFIVKYDNNGSILWAKQAGGYWNQYAQDSVQVIDDLYFTGSSWGDANFDNLNSIGHGVPDIIVAKYSISELTPTPIPTITPIPYPRCGGTTNPKKFSICGKVYFDENKSSWLDPNEKYGFPLMYLGNQLGQRVSSSFPQDFNDWSNWTKYAKKIMLNAGWYEFNNLDPGLYSITIKDQPISSGSYTSGYSPSNQTTQTVSIKNKDVVFMNFGWYANPTPTLTPTPTPFHTYCDLSHSCKSIPGPGKIKCKTNIDCFPSTKTTPILPTTVSP